MRIFLLFIFITHNFFSTSQSNNVKKEILSVIERRDTNSLYKIYEEWSENSIPINSKALNKQYELTKEAYSIYSVIVDFFYDKITSKTGNKNVYVLVNNSIKIDISSQNLDLDSIYEEVTKGFNTYDIEERLAFYPRGCGGAADEFEKMNVSNNYLNHSLYANASFILNNFKPFFSGKDSLYKIIYADESKKYFETFNEAMTDYEIEKSLLKTGKTIEQIRELKGVRWGNYTDISEEKKSRQDFCYPYRLNIKDRVERIVFQPNFRTALVSYVDDYNTFGILYFEKVNSKWEFKEVYIEGRNYCTDCIPPPIR